MNNNFFKYIFATVVVILIASTMFFIVKNRSKTEEYTLDQTSTVSNIQTELRFAISELDTINPILSNNRNVQEVTKIIYDPLVSLDENYKLEYCLAEEIAKVDNLTYIIKLRENIKWQDNSDFTVDDVIFTLDIVKNVNTIYSENIKNVIDLERIDDYKLKIKLSQESPFFEYNLTFPIMCKKYYEGEDFTISDKVPIGTGMFKIAEISDNLIKLVPNENYWNQNKKPMATQININLYSTIGEAYSSFKNGEIDILSVKTDNIEQYIGTLGYNKIEYKSRDYDFLSFNTTNEILSDPAVRRAISLIIDKNNLVASCFENGHVASNFSLDMGFWIYTKDLNIPVDTEQANQILVEDGWEHVNNAWTKKINGRTRRLEFSIAVNDNNQDRINVAENIKNQLKEFGISTTINYYSIDNYVNILNNKEYEAVIAGIQLGYSPNLSTFFGEGNIANYYNTEVLDIIKEVSNTTDENILYEKYNRLYDIYLQEAPYIGLYRNTDILVYNQSLVGNIKANTYNNYHNIEKWYRQ